MKLIDALKYRNDEYKANCDRWSLLFKLTMGGQYLTEKDKKDLLVLASGTPSKVLSIRTDLAPYLSIIGMVLSKLTSHVVAGKGDIEGFANNRATTDFFWDEEFFSKGCFTPYLDKRCSFDAFQTQALLYALIFGEAIAVVDVPYIEGVSTKLQQEIMGGNKPYVCLFPRSIMLDYESKNGELNYVKLYQKKKVRDNWKSEPRIAHCFTIYEMINDYACVSNYEVIDKDCDHLDGLSENSSIEIKQEQQRLFYLTEGSQIISKIPVILLDIPSPLDLASQLSDAQISHFRVGASAEYAMHSSNYAQLVFKKVTDVEDLKGRVTTTGNGFYWVLKDDEDAAWLEREGKAIDRSLQYREEKKQEMLDIISQVATNAVNLTARVRQSGEAKKEDRRQMDILLGVYGQCLKDFVKEVLETASIARGELLNWIVSGFDNYDSDTLQEDLEEYLTTADVIESVTFRKEGQKAIARHAVKELGIDPRFLDKIYQEIDNDSVFEEEEDGEEETEESTVSSNGRGHKTSNKA